MKTPRFWYVPHWTWQSIVLFPMSLLYRLFAWIRRCHLPVRRFSQSKIIVVGNITAGGSGKTPVVIALTTWLTSIGYKVGLVSRGYGGKIRGPYEVTAQDDPKQVGDEALLLAQYAPLVIARRRSKAVAFLLKKHHCDIVISDDGLQHAALARDVEIVVLEGQKRLGNQLLLPAGPLRESAKRLKTVDFVLVNGNARANEFSLKRVFHDLIHLETGEQSKAEEFQYVSCTAFAGIAHPERFFSVLSDAGIAATCYALPDHYFYKRTDLDGVTTERILMTEKDAVKCRQFSDARIWYLPMTVELPDEFKQALLRRLS